MAQARNEAPPLPGAVTFAVFPTLLSQISPLLFPGSAETDARKKLMRHLLLPACERLTLTTGNVRDVTDQQPVFARRAVDPASTLNAPEPPANRDADAAALCLPSVQAPLHAPVVPPVPSPPQLLQLPHTVLTTRIVDAQAERTGPPSTPGVAETPVVPSPTEVRAAGFGSTLATVLDLEGPVSSAQAYAPVPGPLPAAPAAVPLSSFPSAVSPPAPGPTLRRPSTPSSMASRPSSTEGTSISSFAAPTASALAKQRGRPVTLSNSEAQAAVVALPLHPAPAPSGGGDRQGPAPQVVSADQSLPVPFQRIAARAGSRIPPVPPPLIEEAAPSGPFITPAPLTAEALATFITRQQVGLVKKRSTLY